MRKLIVKGKEAGTFLARVTAGPIRPLAVGQGAAGALLTGQAKILAQFDCLRMGEQEFWLMSPVDCYAGLAAGLEKLHFSEDLTIEETQDFFRPKKTGPGARERFFSAGIPWPCFVPGYIWTPSESAESCWPEDWSFDRIGALYPCARTDWEAGETTALEAGFLPFIDRDKGCYPGQEVVERSLNVGQPPKVSLAIEGEKKLEHKQILLFPSGLEGEVRSVGTREGIVRAFVRVPFKARHEAPDGFIILKTWEDTKKVKL